MQSDVLRNREESGGRFDMKRARILPGFALLLAAALVAGDSASQSAGGARALVDGRELMILSPADSRAAPPASPAVSIESYETSSRRIHAVSYGGRTFKASTPLEGPWSLIAFDTAQRKFVHLLPSIRVELDYGTDLDAVAEALNAPEVTVLESLGFAIVRLPGGLHPADAVARVENLNGGPRASMRLRRPRIQWR